MATNVHHQMVLVQLCPDQPVNIVKLVILASQESSHHVL